MVTVEGDRVTWGCTLSNARSLVSTVSSCWFSPLLWILFVVWAACVTVYDQVRVGRLSFAVGSVQFTGRRSVNAMLTILPIAVVVAATCVVVVITCVCCQQRVTRRRSKLSPTRTEYNVNYVHVSEPSLQSDVSGTASVQSHTTGIHLPQNSKPVHELI